MVVNLISIDRSIDVLKEFEFFSKKYSSKDVHIYIQQPENFGSNSHIVILNPALITMLNGLRSCSQKLAQTMKVLRAPDTYIHPTVWKSQIKLQ